MSNDQSKIIVEGDLSPEHQEAVDTFLKEEGLEEAPHEAEGDEEQEALVEGEEVVVKEGDEEGKEVEHEVVAKAIEASGVTKQQLLEELLQDTDTQLTVNRKGNVQKLTFHEIKTALGRVDALQKQVKELRSSDSAMVASMVDAAKSGDKTAQNKLKNLLVQFTGADNEDDMLNALEDVEGEYDDTEAREKIATEAEWEESFGDVKEEVDYQKTLDTMEDVMSSRMPAKVFKAYWDDPTTRRTMYDLVSTGIAEEVLEAFDAEYKTLPLGKRIELDTDPEMYAVAFASVLRSMDKPAAETPIAKKKMRISGTGRTSGRDVQVDSNAEMTDKEYKEILSQLKL